MQFLVVKGTICELCSRLSCTTPIIFDLFSFLRIDLWQIGEFVKWYCSSNFFLILNIYSTWEEFLKLHDKYSNKDILPCSKMRIPKGHMFCTKCRCLINLRNISSKANIFPLYRPSANKYISGPSKACVYFGVRG